jgi:prevent-host-death family protein
MTTISIKELHERTGEWVRKAAASEEITVTDRGRPVARIQAIPESAAVATPTANPWLRRKLLPAFAELQKTLIGGPESTEIISEMRDGR